MQNKHPATGCRTIYIRCVSIISLSCSHNHPQSPQFLTAFNDIICIIVLLIVFITIILLTIFNTNTTFRPSPLEDLIDIILVAFIESFVLITVPSVCLCKYTYCIYSSSLYLLLQYSCILV